MEKNANCNFLYILNKETNTVIRREKKCLQCDRGTIAKAVFLNGLRHVRIHWVYFWGLELLSDLTSVPS